MISIMQLTLHDSSCRFSCVALQQSILTHKLSVTKIASKNGSTIIDIYIYIIYISMSNIQKLFLLRNTKLALCYLTPKTTQSQSFEFPRHTRFTLYFAPWKICCECRTVALLGRGLRTVFTVSNAARRQPRCRRFSFEMDTRNRGQTERMDTSLQYLYGNLALETKKNFSERIFSKCILFIVYYL